MALYINFYFRNLIQNENVVEGIFDAPDSEAFCRFRYDLNTQKYEIWDNNKPEEDLLPIPFWWLEKKINENGKLKESECKISY